MAVPLAPGTDFAPGKPIPLFQPRAHLGGLGRGHVLRRRTRRSIPDQHLRRTNVTARYVVLNWRRLIHP